MATKVAVQKLRHDPVKQISVFLENKVGRLLDIINLLEAHNTHALALTILDTTDSSIIRMVLDDPDRARALLQEHIIPYTESEVIVVELSATTDLHTILSLLLLAEINIHYLYSFLNRPKGKSAIVLHVDDHEVALHALNQNNFKVLQQRDISR
jgi:hypothetical protein